jgi:hypothetical protein
LENCPKLRPLLLDPDTSRFIRPFLRFAAELSAPLAGNSTVLLFFLVGKVLDEQKEKVLCGKIVLNSGPCLNSAVSHFLYDNFFAFCSRTFGPLTGNSSPLLPSWQSTGRAERKGSLWENCPTLQPLLDQATHIFI